MMGRRCLQHTGRGLKGRTPRLKLKAHWVLWLMQLLLVIVMVVLHKLLVL